MDTNIMMIPWASSLQAVCDAYASEIAIEDATQQITFAEFGQRCAGVANVLLNQGIQPGDPVAISLGNSQASVWASYGVRLSGAAETHLNTALAVAERKYYVELLKIAHVITTRAQAQEFELLGCKVHLIEELCDANGSLTDIPAVQAQAHGRIGFTSGTTGSPKAVIQTHGARWIANLLQRATAPTAVGPGNKILLMTPYMHGASVLAMAFLDRGAGIVLLPGVDPERVHHYLDNKLVDHLFAPPTVLAKLVSAPSLQGRSFLDLKAIFSGTAPMTPSLYAQVRQMFGPVVRITYGKTEVTNPITVLSPQQTDAIHRAPHSSDGVCVGYPATGIEVALRAPDGQAIPRGQVGEIFLRGPHMSKGYIDAQGYHALPADGFHQTGDYGQFDEHGRLHLIGRTADVMKSGGYKVHPYEVEQALAPIAPNGAIAIASLRSDYWGDIIIAVGENVPPDWQSRAADALSGLAKHKHPRYFFVLPELPRNAQGKIVRRKLSDMILQDFELTDGAYPSLHPRASLDAS